MKTDSFSMRIALVTGLMITQTMGWGTTFSQVGILAAPIGEEIGITREQVFLGATILYAFAALTAAYAGRLADKIGGLFLLIPGSIVFAAALWALSRAEGMMGYFWPWALIGSVFHVGLVTSAHTGLAQVLGRGATGAIGILTIATGLCSTIFWPLSEWILSWSGWRNAFQIYAIATIAIALPIHAALWWFFGRQRAGDRRDPKKLAVPHVRQGYEPRAQRIMILTASFGSLLGVGFGIGAIEVFTALGTPRSEAVYAGSLIGIAYVVSRLIALGTERWIAPPALTSMTYALLPLSLCPLLPYALSGAPLPGFVAASVAFAFGLPAGLVGLMKSILPLYLFGSDGYGARLGRQASATETASAIAPFGFTAALGLSVTGLLSGLTLSGGLVFLAAARLTTFTKRAETKKTV